MYIVKELEPKFILARPSSRNVEGGGHGQKLKNLEAMNLIYLMGSAKDIFFRMPWGPTSSFFLHKHPYILWRW